MPAERVFIFFDAPNLYRGAEELCGWGKLRMFALRDELAAGRIIVGCQYWTAPFVEQVNPAKYAKQRWWFDTLRRGGITVMFGEQILRGGVWREKGIDVGIATYLIRHALEDQYDTAIVVSSDCDLVEAIKFVCNTIQKRVEVVVTEGRFRESLCRAASSYRILRRSKLKQLLEV